MDIQKNSKIIVHRTQSKYVLQKMNARRSLIKTIKQGKCVYFGHLIRGDGLQSLLLEGRFNGKRGRGRPRSTWFDDIKEGQREDWKSITANLLRAEVT